MGRRKRLCSSGRPFAESAANNNNNKMGARTYVDGQLRWTPSFLTNGLQLALGANNLFDKDPPGCLSCDLNSFDPNVYDRFIYFRLSYRQ